MTPIEIDLVSGQSLYLHAKTDEALALEALVQGISSERDARNTLHFCAFRKNFVVMEQSPESKLEAKSRITFDWTAVIAIILHGVAGGDA